MLLTNKKANKRNQKHNLLGGGNEKTTRKKAGTFAIASE